MLFSIVYVVLFLNITYLSILPVFGGVLESRLLKNLNFKTRNEENLVSLVIDLDTCCC
jgi:hypothetical protein